jgi:argininosuccinate lyase
MAKKNDSLWGGRFEKQLDEVACRFSYSLACDKTLLPYDIQTNIAHVKTLGKAKILTAKEVKQLISGLRAVETSLQKEDLSPYYASIEDIHSLIQMRLEKKVGMIARKLHTARSRNDQVITATKLYLKDNLETLIQKITQYQKALLVFAAKGSDVAIPSYTHLQRAQVVLMAHHVLAYVEMAERDKKRCASSLAELDEMPLGSGAAVGLSFPLDRKYTAQLLGFKKVSQNSMDAVSSRDSILSVLSDIAILFTHFSRLAEDLILWSSQEFSFVTLPDDFSTGSSIMPHKKNPDMLELLRGRTGKTYGNLISVLVAMKGLPLAYNRDMQEDKEALFSSVELASVSLDVLIGMLPKMTIRKHRCLISANDSLLFATDLMDYIVKKGVPLKDAHEVVGKMVLYSMRQSKDLSQLSFAEFKKFSPRIEKDIIKVFSPESSLHKRVTLGSTHPRRVQQMLRRWNKKLA